MINKELINKMNSIESIDTDKLFIKTIDAVDLKLLDIRDYVIEKGEILEEDIEQCIYVTYFRTGLFHLNRTLVGFILEENKLIVVANASKKSTNEKLVNAIIDDLINSNKKNRSTSRCIKIGVISLLVLLCGILAIFAFPTISATKEYNNVVSNFNDLAKSYNKKVSLVSVDNIEGVPKKIDYLKEENDSVFPIVVNILEGNTSNKINKDIKTINNMIKTLNDSSSIIDNVTNPSKEDVIEKLKNVNEIENISFVTKDNDPNGFLEKEQGYTSCVYFTLKGLELNYKSKDPIVLGTDGGGSIEVYSNLKDALARCNYLKQFDNTILYTGSYAIVGTMVIRTSYVLTNEQQYSLTNKIIQQFTKV